MNKLEQQVGEQARRILHLETTSTSVQDRIKRFSEGKYLPVDEVEKMFSLPAVFDDNAFGTCCGKVRSPKEKGLQELVAEMLPILSPSSTFCDCRAPNGITFAGRRHDIDLVLFAQHVRSMETVVLPIELKLSIAGDADRRDVVLQLLDRMVLRTHAVQATKHKEHSTAQASTQECIHSLMHRSARSQPPTSDDRYLQRAAEQASPQMTDPERRAQKPHALHQVPAPSTPFGLAVH